MSSKKGLLHAAYIQLSRVYVCADAGCTRTSSQRTSRRRGRRRCAADRRWTGWKCAQSSSAATHAMLMRPAAPSGHPPTLEGGPAAAALEPAAAGDGPTGRPLQWLTLRWCNIAMAWFDLTVSWSRRRRPRAADCQGDLGRWNESVVEYIRSWSLWFEMLDWV